MLKPMSKSILSFYLILLSTVAHGSLITNGSFESLTFSDDSSSTGIVHGTNLQKFSSKNSAWDVFYTLPGWITTSGSGIELQKNVVTQSAEGSHHIELDAHPRGSSNAVMTQTLESLTIGSDYLLEFSYKPRTNNENDNGINVFWYDQAIDFNVGFNPAYTIDGTHKATPFWITQSVVLTAQSETMDLSFGAFGKQNSLGGLLDNISLVQFNPPPVTDIPEPSVFALSLLGLIAIGRRHFKRPRTCKK